MDKRTELLLELSKRILLWEHEERASYDLEDMRKEFEERLKNE
jgi:hypothetical protein